METDLICSAGSETTITLKKLRNQPYFSLTMSQKRSLQKASYLSVDCCYCFFSVTNIIASSTTAALTRSLIS